MIWLAVAIATFLATHVLPGIKPLRRFCILRLGERLYLGLYSSASIAVIAWVIWAYVQAPYWEIWPSSTPNNWAPVLVMPIACFLIVGGISATNPFSLGMGAKNFNPASPGLVGFFKHPVLWGLTLWAITHIIANGDVASAMVFGCLGFLSAAGPTLLDRRRKTALGEAQWHELAAQVKAVSVVHKILQIGPWRSLAAMALYAFLLFSHGPIIGVSPLSAVGL